MQSLDQILKQLRAVKTNNPENKALLKEIESLLLKFQDTQDTKYLYEIKSICDEFQAEYQLDLSRLGKPSVPGFFEMFTKFLFPFN